MKNWRQLFRGIGGRLFFLTVFPLLFMGILCAASLFSLTSQGRDLKTLVDEHMPKAALVSRMRLHESDLVRQLFAALESIDPAARNEAIGIAKSRISEFSDTKDMFFAFDLSPEMKNALGNLDERWKKAQELSAAAIHELGAGTADGDRQARQVLRELSAATQAISETLQKAESLGAGSTETLVKSAVLSSGRVRWTVIGTSVCGVLLLLFSGLFVTLRVTRMLTELVQQLGRGGESVRETSVQLSGLSQRLSSEANTAAASLEETVASLEELGSMVNLNSDNAQQAATLSSASNDAATQGDQEIGRLIEAMDEIAKGSKQVEEIIGVIDDIAFQTNLLALNAAVEAARAGEQGKGFAVVADAVRNLAQRSASAAKDISTLIKASVAKTQNGSKIAEESGAALKNIVTSVRKIADINSEIANASQQQSTGIEQINQAMNQLDSATQNNAASAEQAAASSEQLSNQAGLLQEIVSKLSGVVYGTSAAGVVSDSSRAKQPQKLKVIQGGKSEEPRVAPEKVLPFDASESAASEKKQAGGIQGF